MLLAQGCQKKPYSQATPDDVIKSAQQMIEKGEARKLERLIYAENPEMRKVIQRMGRLFGSLGELAVQVNTSFPKEVEQLKGSASSGGLARLMGEFSNQRRRRPNLMEEPSAEDPFAEAFKQVLVDPYGWLRDNTGRLTTTPIDDNTVALLWDGKPMLAPLGMIMRKDKGEWFLVLPTNIPVVAQLMPRTSDEYRIIEKLVVVIDNAVKDLTKDIKSGKIPDLTEASRAAGQKALAPAALVMIAYGNMMEQRKNAAQAAPAAASAKPQTTAPAGPK
jgi:hypothetical protein